MADDWAQTKAAATAVLALHARPGFVIPNVWDAGSARLLEQLGFPALATTSAGIAWARGLPDGQRLGADVMLESVADIVSAVTVPVTADLEAGYGDVARTVERAVELGVVGANLEDSQHGGLVDVESAVQMLVAARGAAPSGTFVLNARTDAFFVGTSGDPFDETVARAHRYLDAGADCVFVPGVADAATISRLVEAIPAPVNIVAGLTQPIIDTATLLSLGVVRVSVGGSIARAAYSAVAQAGRELLATGTLNFLDGALGYADLQRSFGG